MFQKVFEYAGPWKKKVMAAAFVMLAGVFMSICPFIFAYQIITPVLMGVQISPSYLILRIAASAICLVLHAVLYVQGLSMSHEAAYNILMRLRVSLQGRMEKLPLGVIQEKGTGSLKRLFVDDVESLEVLLAHAVPEGLSNVMAPIVVYLALLFVDWKLALLSLASLPVGLAAMMAMYAIGMKGMEGYYAAGKKMNNTIIEYINGMEVVKVFNRDAESYERYQKDVKGYRDLTLDWYRACWPWMAVYNSILPCTVLLTLPVGSLLVLRGYSTLPDLILVLCLSFSIGLPLIKALGFLPSMPQVNYKISALEQMLSAEPLKQGTKQPKPETGGGDEIVFRDVNFAYGEELAVRGVNLKIRDGQKTAIVGESGSGKSTLAKLLIHYYDVAGGQILLNGTDIRDMSLEALNSRVAYVSQEQYLFNTTLRENIRIGRLDATDEEVLEAAGRAQCMEFIDRLPDGLDTMAGDGGKRLSGGERQRIAIARAILKDAPVIVLDEATAFMDPENEEKMNAAIEEVIRGKTQFVIAHRLETICGADQICVMKKGELIDTGTHEELLERCAEYEKLWNAAVESTRWQIGGKGDR